MNMIFDSNYTYLANKCCNPDVNALDIFSDLINGQLHYICYHVTTNGKYPFIQIMLELDLNFEPLFVLPSVTIDKDFTNVNISNMLLRKIKAELKRLKCKTDLLTTDSYKGMFSFTDYLGKDNVYALIDVSSVDINCLNLSKSVTTWFALPTEIININSICDIPISKKVSYLFTYVMPELGVLYKSDVKNEPYLLPDVVYTSCDNIKEAEFRSIFGPPKSINHFNNYFEFSSSFSKIPLHSGIIEEPSVSLKNRYALFIENDLCIPNILDNQMILVNEYESFTPLSYHVV
jgi:hypothetical protein